MSFLASIVSRTFHHFVLLSVLSGLGMFGRAKKVGLEFNALLMMVMIMMMMMMTMMMMMSEAKAVIRK